MIDNETLQKCITILDRRKADDKELRKAWTGEATSLVSAKVQIIRRLKVEIQARKREKRTETHSGSKPWGARSEPWNIDLWNDYKSDDWIGYGWEKVDEFWKSCSHCDGSGRKECTSCDGRGRKTCSTCEGHGEITTYE